MSPLGCDKEGCAPPQHFEYMAHAKPIICSDIPVFHEVLSHEESCLFVSPSDVDAWVAAISRLTRDAATRARIARTGRDQLERCYTWDRRAKRVLEAIEAGP